MVIQKCLRYWRRKRWWDYLLEKKFKLNKDNPFNIGVFWIHMVYTTSDVVFQWHRRGIGTREGPDRSCPSSQQENFLSNPTENSGINNN